MEARARFDAAFAVMRPRLVEAITRNARFQFRTTGGVFRVEFEMSEEGRGGPISRLDTQVLGDTYVSSEYCEEEFHNLTAEVLQAPRKQIYPDTPSLTVLPRRNIKREIVGYGLRYQCIVWGGLR